ncbi:hypothetical protein PoB_002565600 [Plakobranchus ocellatus]|uniref:Secreted protein n=1 Tax=Plakobranchus ocellatus TaxID=259542 RepID=A0AAV3ZT43_9GAST|nr:hypothetical protein PoB_002565600 [Plakobranchus ocellatus]
MKSWYMILTSLAVPTGKAIYKMKSWYMIQTGLAVPTGKAICKDEELCPICVCVSMYLYVWCMCVCVYVSLHGNIRSGHQPFVHVTADDRRLSAAAAAAAHRTNGTAWTEDTWGRCDADYSMLGNTFTHT